MKALSSFHWLDQGRNRDSQNQKIELNKDSKRKEKKVQIKIEEGNRTLRSPRVWDYKLYHFVKTTLEGPAGRGGLPQRFSGKEFTAEGRPRFDPLGQEDPLEEAHGNHSSTLVWRIPWTEWGVWQATAHGVTKRQTWRENCWAWAHTCRKRRQRPGLGSDRMATMP